jgi:hypothetical protein
VRNWAQVVAVPPVVQVFSGWRWQKLQPQGGTANAEKAERKRARARAEIRTSLAGFMMYLLVTYAVSSTAPTKMPNACK